MIASALFYKGIANEIFLLAYTSASRRPTRLLKPGPAALLLDSFLTGLLLAAM